MTTFPQELPPRPYPNPRLQHNHRLPAPVSANRRNNRIRGGGLSCCAISLVVGGLFVGAGVLAVGLYFGLFHKSGTGASNSNGGSFGGNGGPTSTGGVSIPTSTQAGSIPTASIVGGTGGTALANANLQSLVLGGCSPDDYSAEVTIGGQSFRLSVDSGSSTTGVADGSCTTCDDGSCTACDVSPLYSPGSSAQNTGETASTLYGDYSGWSGNIYTDTLVGGTTSSNLTAPVTMNIVAITKTDAFFHGPDCLITGNSQTPDTQGIWGLGPVDLNSAGTDDFPSKLAAVSGEPNAYSFMACDYSPKGSGYLTFGGYNPKYVTQDPQFVPMAAMSEEFPYYGVNVDTVSLGGTAVLNNVGPSLVDTGTSNIVLNSASYSLFINALKSNAAINSLFDTNALLGQESECAAVKGGVSRAQVDSQLPTMQIDVSTSAGTTTLTLDATKSYMLPQAMDADSTSTGRYCLAVGNGTASTSTILGNTLMRGMMVVMDLANQQIGFAPSKGCPLTLS